MRRTQLVPILAACSTCLASVASTIGFEPPEYVVGDPLPAGWTIYNPSNAQVGVTTSDPSAGSQCLAVGYNGGGAAHSAARYAIDVEPSGSATVSFDVRPAPFITDFNFFSYGRAAVFNDISVGETVLFFTREFGQNRIKAQVPGDEAILGAFVPGTYYRVEFGYDWDANTRTIRVETLAGGLIGEHVFSNTSDRTLKLVDLGGGGAVGFFNHYDELLIDDGAVPGDLDGDGVVGGSDLGVLLAAWGTTDPVADLDGSGMVDGGDLGALLADWSAG